MANDLSTIRYLSPLAHEGFDETTFLNDLQEDLLPAEERQGMQDVSQKDAQQFLRLKMFPDNTVLLSMEHLSEVLTIPLEQVVPIPGMPPWVMGIYNLRGDVLWISDLSHFLDFLPWHQQVSCVATYTIVVLNIPTSQLGADVSDSAKAQKIGLIVKQTEDIEWCDADDIQSSWTSNMSSRLSQFLQGYWLKSNGEMLAVLDGQSILEGMSNDV